jgi:DNA-binding NarL/FixJ family response regulator
MLVEDNIPFRERVRVELLSLFSSMKVIEASNGKEAFKGLASYPIDLIFMDISLTGQNGLVLTKKIKSRNPTVAVVMLTGYDLDAYRMAALKSGANGFIGKNSVNLSEQILIVVSCFWGAKGTGRLKPCCFLLQCKKKVHRVPCQGQVREF